MNCTCCLRRNVPPLNCNCVRPGICRERLKCSRHCECGKKARLPGCARLKQPDVKGGGFVEAGPGSCAGTAHEGVFKAVAARLCSEPLSIRPSAVGGTFEDTN
jgi:hypothetical protein